jgi:hypothetical protein
MAPQGSVARSKRPHGRWVVSIAPALESAGAAHTSVADTDLMLMSHVCVKMLNLWDNPGKGGTGG